MNLLFLTSLSAIVIVDVVPSIKFVDVNFCPGFNV